VPPTHPRTGRFAGGDDAPVHGGLQRRLCVGVRAGREERRAVAPRDLQAAERR
ncbi:MAG: hypothetical protein AVDCRST_MAG18-3985, partial [uncultured Thermomicrobiales bacterium]